MAKKYTQEEFVEKAISVHGDKYTYEKTVYQNSKSKVIITCKKHGDFIQQAESHIGRKGSGCPKCKGEKITLLKRSSTEYFINRAIKIHGYYYDYSRVKYTTNRDTIEIICPNHGLFLQKPSDHLDGCGCRLCGREKTISATKTHGQSNHFLYNNWGKIKSRCYNVNEKSYERYGRRGIQMSEEFKNDFIAFKEYVENLPDFDKRITESWSLDRIDNSKGYERGNLRWANIITQRANQKVRGKYGYDGINVDKHGQWKFVIVSSQSGFPTLEAALSARNKYIEKHNLPHKIQK